MITTFDPPDHQAWECPDCGAQFLKGTAAYVHATGNQHNLPVLRSRRLYAKPVTEAEAVAVPVGNFLRAGDSLRVAISLAEIALELAEQRGAGAKIVAHIRNQINQLKES